MNKFTQFLRYFFAVASEDPVCIYIYIYLQGFHYTQISEICVSRLPYLDTHFLYNSRSFDIRNAS